MKVSKEGLALIKEFEGLYLKAYTDCVGVWTIGWGITNADYSITGTRIRKGLTISRATAEAWLEKSLERKYVPKVMKYYDKYHWNQNQFDALVSFAFNVGSIDGLTANGTRSLETVRKKILEYDKAGGKRIRGLSRRREAEYALFCKACTPSVTNKKLLSLLSSYHTFIKEHHTSFINKYDGKITTFDIAKDRIAKGEKVGITCVVPLRWALSELGIKQSSGKALISAPNGSFATYYTGDVKTYFNRITTGGPIGKTVVEAINTGLLVEGDIVCYENLTHTSVFSGIGYKFYEGGGVCAKDDYKGGVLLDYSKNWYKSRKIAEVLRFKDTYIVKEKPAKKEDYNMPIIKKGSEGKAVKMWQVILDVTVDGKFGPQTEAATKAFQKKHKLKEDGIVGGFTWSAGIGTL